MPTSMAPGCPVITDTGIQSWGAAHVVPKEPDHAEYVPRDVNVPTALGECTMLIILGHNAVHVRDTPSHRSLCPSLLTDTKWSMLFVIFSCLFVILYTCNQWLK